MDRRSIEEAQRVLAESVAVKARANGDEFMIHLLAAAELATKSGEYCLAGHLLHLCGFRESGCLSAVCGAVAPQLAVFHAVRHAQEGGSRG